MLKRLLIAVLLLLALAFEANAQERPDLVVQPGDSLLILVTPGFYQDTLPPVQDTLPPVVLPPVQDTLPAYQDTLPPVVLPPVQDTLPPVQDTVIVEVCPEGWTCTPPPDTTPPPTVAPLLARSTAGTMPDTVALDGTTARPGDRVFAWLNIPRDSVTRVVEFLVNGKSVRNEYAWRHSLGGGDSPITAWVVPDSLSGPVEIRARRFFNDGRVPEDVVATLNVVADTVPTTPPDTVPTTPPDTVPPLPGDTLGASPGDTIIGQVPLGTPQNLRLVRDDACWISSQAEEGTCYLVEFDPIPEDTVQTCVNCGTWWERMAVVNDDSVIGDEVYYSVGAWEGTAPYPGNPGWEWSSGDALSTTSFQIPTRLYPLPDTVTVCAGAVAWDARSYEGPGGAVRYCGETSVGWRCSHLYPRSEVNCVTLSPPGPA